MKYLITLMCLSVTLITKAQDIKSSSNEQDNQEMELNAISFMGGLTFSSFIFDDTQIAINNQYDYKVDASIGLNFEFETNRHLLRPELLYRRVGSSSEINETQLSWSLSYLDLNLGYLFRILDSKKFKIATGLSVGAGFMMQGTQYIGQVMYDANDDRFLDRFDLTSSFLLNFNFKLSKTVDLFAEYRFGISILNLEKDNDQSTRNMFHILGTGLSFHIFE